MEQVSNMEQFVTLTVFIAVIVPCISGVVIGFYILFSRNNDLKVALDIQDIKIKSLQIDYDSLSKEHSQLLSKYDNFISERNENQLQFTETLGKIYVSLGKLENSIKHIEDKLKEIKK